MELVDAFALMGLNPEASLEEAETDGSSLRGRNIRTAVAVTKR